MAGTRAGGLKAAKTNRMRYGSGDNDFYKTIGRKGGHTRGALNSDGTGRGFAGNPERATEAGRKGVRSRIAKRS